MSTPLWQPGTQYLPGAIVAPRTDNVVVQTQPADNSFESGTLAQWTVTGEHCTNGAASGAASTSTAHAYDGSEAGTVGPVAGDGTGPLTSGGLPVAFAVFTNSYRAPVTPGQVINFALRAWHLFVPDTSQTYPWSAGARIAWYNASNAIIGYSYANTITNGGQSAISKGMFAFTDSIWVTITGKGVAPAGAAFASAVAVIATTSYGTQADYVDYFTWDYTHQGYPTGLAFVATQSGPGTSAATEPVWPVTSGVSVQDGSVTWEGEYASQVTWTAASILKSGATQPVWPTLIGGAIGDGSIEWTATDGRITDANCPQSKIVAIASSKVYAFDNDIIRYSATVSARDWSTPQDAGFIPFGLNTYGNEPGTGLGIYRSNLVAFNTLGYQMWQVDPDPANIAILDAEPVGCGYNKSIQPVNNDLVFCSPVGIRNIGTAGASGNLQAGQFGKQVDPIVKGLLKTLVASGFEPRALFNPGTGQYWFLVGTEAVVLSINGNNVMSWSRYSFPSTITDWTVMAGVLYLRAGDLVWTLDEGALNDDVDQGTGQGGTTTGFDGYMAWNYIECGALGVDKMMEGFDLVIGDIDDDGLIVNNNIVCNVSVGYNQANPEMATEPWPVDGDTVPGTMVPMPVTAPSFQMRLDFGTGQNWGWAALNLYVTPV